MTDWTDMTGVNPTTTSVEDYAFESHCRDGTCTLQSAMKFFRRKNRPGLREAFINQDVPKHLKERVTIQCKLEGLI